MDGDVEMFDITVVEYPEKHLVGVKVRTTMQMQKGMADCPALWESFMPRMGELPSGNAYGVCVMLNAEDFDYWAALEADVNAAVPEGMACVDVPAGKYAKCTVDMEKLRDAYTYICTEWEKSQTEYVLDGQAPSFELYQANWQLGDSFEIFAPVKK